MKSQNNSGTITSTPHIIDENERIPVHEQDLDLGRSGVPGLNPDPQEQSSGLAGQEDSLSSERHGLWGQSWEEDGRLPNQSRFGPDKLDAFNQALGNDPNGQAS